MIRRFWILSLAISASLGLAVGPATAQQSGGILKFFHRDSPASMSIHEEATISTVAPMMGVFNNLVLFKQDERQNRPEFIRPELAESWSWDEGNTRLTFKLRQGVKWHDGKPFTAADVEAHLGHARPGNRRAGCGSTRARPGTATSKRSSPTAIIPSHLS